MRHRQVTFSHAALRQLWGRLTAPDREVLCPAGVARLNEHWEALVYRVPWTAPEPGSAAALVLVRAGPSSGLLLDRLEELAHQATGGRAALVALGVGPAAGQVGGLCFGPDGPEPLHAVAVVGPGLPRVMLSHPVSAPGPAALHEEAWSRTVGALGAGTWRRLRELHVAIVGCGRSGSLAATALQRLGVGRLTLLDPEVLEVGNLGEMDGVTPADVGRAKVEAVAGVLRAGWPALAVGPVAESVLALPGLVAVKGADVLLGCADRPRARLATSCLAALYLKPLLDVGTGVFHEDAGRRLGADVRLVLPGRCLLCLGGVAGGEQAVREVLAGTSAGPVDWRRQRAGSLRSLNGVAVYLGLRLLEELVAGRLGQSVWQRLEFDGAGLPRLEPHLAPVDAGCRLCGLAGSGDEGVLRLRSELGAGLETPA
jgi:hypothetical protein